MAQAEAFGEVGDGRFCAVGGSGDVEQELVLLGLKAGLGGAEFAEVKELAECVAEFCQGLDSLAVYGVVHEDNYIVLRCLLLDRRSARHTVAGVSGSIDVIDSADVQ